MRYKDKNDQGDIPGYGAIFMSNTGTKKECFQRKLLGLPLGQSNFVLHVKKGMILFLFEFEKRQLHGVFRATSNGAIDIEPNSFKSSGKRFPAQVRFTPVWNCNPLAEHEFMDAIRDNYFTGKKFKFGLSKDQVYKLITLFHSKRIPKKPTGGDARFGDNRRNIRDRIRFVNQEDGQGFNNEEIKEVDDQGYRTCMKERAHKDNKEGFLRNYITQSDDLGKTSVARNDENFLVDGNANKIKYFRDDNRIQDDYHDRGSQMIDDGGYFGHETVEREQRRLIEHQPYEPRGTDYGIKLGSDEDFGLGGVALTTHSYLSHSNQINSDFIPIPEVPEQYQHPFGFNNTENTYERVYSSSTSCDPTMITLHTPYDPEVPDFCHRPYDPEVPEFCHKSSYFAPVPGSSPVGNPSLYPISKSDTIPYHSQNKGSDLGKFRSTYKRKVSVFDRLTSAPKPLKNERELESDEKDELDASVDKVMKMLEKIVSSPIKRTRKRQSTFKQDDDDNITPSKDVHYELPEMESDEVLEGESVIEETRVVDFKRRKKVNKNFDDESKEGGTESDVGRSRKRRKLVRPVFVKQESTDANEPCMQQRTCDETTPLKVDCYLPKTVESSEGQKGSIEGEVSSQVEENCKVLEEQPQVKDASDDMARIDSSKDDRKTCGLIEG